MARKAVGVPSKQNEKPALVSICQSQSADANSLLKEVLERSGFWKSIEIERKANKVPKAKFRILIKPDLEVYDLDANTGTDSSLVEHLVDLLFEKGYTNVALADGTGQSDLWLENRDPLILADL